MRSIERQSSYYLGQGPKKEVCEACGQWGSLKRHAKFGQNYCSNCTEAANSLDLSGPGIQTGYNR